MTGFLSSPEVDRFVEFVHAIYGARAVAILLLGSRANGYETPTSDVDLHVLVTNLTRDDAAGLYKFRSDSLEFHTIAIDEASFAEFAGDVRAQSMENVALTLFSHIALEGRDIIEAAQSAALIREAAMLRAWLSTFFGERRTLSDFSLRQVAQLMIVRKLSNAPPLVERFARKAAKVGLDKTIDSVELNLQLVRGQLDAGRVDFRPAGPLRSSIDNLMALSARHGKILQDRKAIKGGLVYGAPYFGAVILEVMLDRKRVADIIMRIVTESSATKDDRAISSFLDEAGSVVGFARRKRNEWKDKVI